MINIYIYMYIILYIYSIFGIVKKTYLKSYLLSVKYDTLNIYNYL